MPVEIRLNDDRTQYKPGETLNATVSWSDEQFDELTAYLLWYTEGIGNQDSQVVDEQPVSTGGRSGERDVTFTLPPSPYAFSGKLITLVWAVEVLAKPGDNHDRKSFTMSPTGEEVQLVETRQEDDGAAE